MQYIKSYKNIFMIYGLGGCLPMYKQQEHAVSYKPLKIPLAALILVISFKMLTTEYSQVPFTKALASRQYGWRPQQSAQLQTQNLQSQSFQKEELHFNKALLYIEPLCFHQAYHPRGAFLVNLDIGSVFCRGVFVLYFLL